MADVDTSPPADTSSKIATAVAPAAAAPSPTSVPAPRFLLHEKTLDLAFNDIWANNANAISHCYSNTDALKVDFTRTGKRSWLGMINDATNSVYRMVQGAVTDFFRQTVLDFTYGSIGLHGLEKYYDDLNSRDPSESVRLARVRASAIESCTREVVPETEEVVGGWTLCSPLQKDTVQALKLEEKVVLLTAKALYVCSYDFGSEKLNEFTKVLVGDIVGIQEGLYVISPNDSSHPDDNWGLVVIYLNSISRTNTAASMKNINLDAASAAAAESTHIFAFRAITDELGDTVVPDIHAGARSRHLHHTVKATSRGEAEEDDEDGCITSKQKVRRIVEHLRVACSDAGVFDIDDETSEGKTQFVTHETIQSLDEAKAMMPYFGELIEGLKRRLWL
ncbi:Inositol phosphatase [Kalmanozyma brasiliensis GHG001]|uniref:HSac2 domain-containing protein n=1 Tax=Kalmanozyma brasiliensis (strain GHG001) TaxID=1365824 RepID=V5EX21_KALBG|nr:Inositol phosphatase [Kalmanozyma brasiliensis GHG001]EST07958.1 Inositol phosphatase [Kalmanozyma brasiliensis GHG001]